MGAWTFIEPNLEWVLEHIGAKARRPRYAGRDLRGHGDGSAEPPSPGAEGAGRGSARHVRRAR